MPDVPRSVRSPMRFQTYLAPLSPTSARRVTRRRTSRAGRANAVDRKLSRSCGPGTSLLSVGGRSRRRSGVRGRKVVGRRVARGGLRTSWRERGAVTAEMALVLPVLVGLLLLGIWSIGLVVMNIRCIDAARDVARAVARGESVETAQAIGHRTVPSGTVTITREGADIHVTVAVKPAHSPPLLTFITPTELAATAILQSEPGTP
ncbi:TadE family type IV pilus minor pilin [Kribbella sp. WER1]